MSDEIDCVARAIYGCVGTPLTAQVPWWNDLPGSAQAFLREQAFAAIRALREPSDRMVSDGQLTLDDGKDLKTVWRSMIDAALDGFMSGEVVEFVKPNEADS
jgi:hypothetical protein